MALVFSWHEARTPIGIGMAGRQLGLELEERFETAGKGSGISDQSRKNKRLKLNKRFS